MGGYHMQFFGGYWMMPLFMILIVVAVVWIVKIVVKPNETKTSAIQLQNILKERLAKGEINQQEYETLKKVLT
ncbi:MAG: SHOCT domain-containing protein [SAR324 cluster bacterium]|nr:SHOCT domain-containing protein [SAR324 cluster bacterium]